MEVKHDLSNELCASTPEEVAYIKKVPYASARKKQTTIAMHSAQAEYVAASEAAMKAVWIRKFVGDLVVMPSINKPINMYCDNSAAIIFANEPG
nr:zinc finger, CCHC-type [Tanacetum cinerariifolium]